MSILGLVLARAAIGIGRITTRSSLKAGGVAVNPQGPETSFDPSEPNEKKHVHRGGSFLCNDQYCSRYIVGTRGKGEVNTGTNHLGFRCVKSAEQVATK
jgi:formylglycine-generating enzyme required for sulfatase activity